MSERNSLLGEDVISKCSMFISFILFFPVSLFFISSEIFKISDAIQLKMVKMPNNSANTSVEYSAI